MRIKSSVIGDDCLNIYLEPTEDDDTSPIDTLKAISDLLDGKNKAYVVRRYLHRLNEPQRKYLKKRLYKKGAKSIIEELDRLGDNQLFCDAVKGAEMTR